MRGELQGIKLGINGRNGKILHDVTANFGREILPLLEYKKGLSPALFLNSMTMQD
jgi:hypothetical protein